MIVKREKYFGEKWEKFKGAMKGAGKGALYGAGFGSPLAGILATTGHLKGGAISLAIPAAMGAVIGAKTGYEFSKDRFQNKQYIDKPVDLKEVYAKYPFKKKLDEWTKKLEKLGAFEDWLKKYNLPLYWIDGVWSVICIPYPYDFIKFYDNSDSLLLDENENSVVVWNAETRYDDVMDGFKIIYNKEKDLFEKWGWYSSSAKISEGKGINFIKTAIIEMLKKNLNNQITEKTMLNWLDDTTEIYTDEEKKNYFKTSLKALKDYTNEIIKILN